jgi:hypothetical protein
MPGKKQGRKKLVKDNQTKKKPLSNKKKKQKKKREKLEKIKFHPKSEPEEEFKDRRKYYLAIALMKISQILAEQGDLTWGGIVDPVTYEVVEDYWPGTGIPISEIDKSRINAASSTVFTGDPTLDVEYMKSFIPTMGGGKNKHRNSKGTELI